MTREQLVERVEFWRRRICPELRVSIMDRPPPRAPDDEYAAIVETTMTISEARIYFAPSTLDYDDPSIDRIIVHELVHPLLDRVLEQADALKPHVSPVGWEIFRAQQRDAMEEFTDRMAHAIADSENGRPSFLTREASAGAPQATTSDLPVGD